MLQLQKGYDFKTCLELLFSSEYVDGPIKYIKRNIIYSSWYADLLPYSSWISGNFEVFKVTQGRHEGDQKKLFVEVGILAQFWRQLGGRELQA